MAMSPGGLAGIILFIILFHIAVLVSYYFWVLRNPSRAEKFTPDERYFGDFRWASLLLISLSWIFSVATTSACTFLKIHIRGQDAWVGMNAFEHPSEGCTRFTSINNRNNPAFTFAVFNCLLTSVGLFGMMLMQFVLTRARKNFWLTLRIFMYVSMWCCIFTFYIQETDTCDVYECSLGGAGIAQIFNVIWLVIACVLMFLTPHGDDTGIKTLQKQQALDDDDMNFVNNQKAEEAPDSPSSAGKAIDMSGQITETQLPDGSVQRKVSINNPDGSKTVTTTIERPDAGGGNEDGDFINPPEEGDDDEHPTDGAV